MKIELLKNHRTERRHYLKGQIITVTPVLGTDWVGRKIAKVAGLKVETAQRIELKETR